MFVEFWYKNDTRSLSVEKMDYVPRVGDTVVLDESGIERIVNKVVFYPSADTVIVYFLT